MRIRRAVPVASLTTRQPVDLRANGSAAMVAVLFGASVVAVRVAVRDVPPVSLAVLRFRQGSLLLAGALLVVAGERLTRRQVAGVGLSFVGIGLAFVEPGRPMGDAMSLVGNGLLLLTGLLGALYGLIALRILAVDSAATVTT